jgi:hypothetical protein
MRLHLIDDISLKYSFVGDVTRIGSIASLKREGKQREMSLLKKICQKIEDSSC